MQNKDNFNNMFTESDNDNDIDVGIIDKSNIFMWMNNEVGIIKNQIIRDCS